MNPYWGEAAYDSYDPADMEDELRERSETINTARDHAYECGAEECDDPEPSEDSLLGRFGHERLVTDYKDGRATALMQVQA